MRQDTFVKLAAVSLLLSACDDKLPPATDHAKPDSSALVQQQGFEKTKTLVSSLRHLHNTRTPQDFNAAYLSVMDSALSELGAKQILNLTQDERFKIAPEYLLQNGLHVHFTAAPEGGVFLGIYRVKQTATPEAAQAAGKSFPNLSVAYYEVQEQLESNRPETLYWIAATVEGTQVGSDIIYNPHSKQNYPDVSETQVYANELAHAFLFQGMKSGEIPVLPKVVQEAYSDFCTIRILDIGKPIQEFVNSLSKTAHRSPQYAYSSKIVTAAYVELASQIFEIKDPQTAGYAYNETAKILASSEDTQKRFKELLLARYQTELKRFGIPDKYLESK